MLENRSKKIDFLGLSRDWIDVRVPAQWEQAREWFEGSVGVQCESFVPPARTGYREGLVAPQPQSTSQLSLMGDNPRSLGWSMFSASGAASEWGWNAVIDHFRVAQANRIDVALDFRCSQWMYDRLLQLGGAICEGHGIAPELVGYSGDAGLSLYFNKRRKVGVSKGEVSGQPQFSAILYEKGKMLGVDPSWKRFELRNRPDKGRMKERALLLEPHEILGSTAWSRAFLSEIGYTDAVKPGRASPFAQTVPVSVDAKVARKMSTVAHMGEQYGEAVRDLVRLVGEDEARRIVETALFRPVIVQDDGREISGPALIRRQAQQRWSDVFRDDLQRKQFDAGAGGMIH